MQAPRIHTIYIQTQDDPISITLSNSFEIVAIWNVFPEFIIPNVDAQSVSLLIIKNTLYDQLPILYQQLSQLGVDMMFIEANDKFHLSEFKVSLPIQSSNNIEDCVPELLKRQQIRQILDHKITNFDNSQKKHTWILIQKGKSKVVILHRDIEYIEAQEKFCYIYTSNGLRHVHFNLLKEVANTLQNDLFFRSHKSYIVNTHKIKEIHNDNIMLMESGVTIPIARRRKNCLRV